MRKLTVFAAWAIAWAALPRAVAGGDATNFTTTTVAGDPVVARGKGFEIRRSDMDQVLGSIKAHDPQDKLPPDARLHVVNQLIEIQLILQKATDDEKAEGKRAGELKFTNVVKSLDAQEFERRLKVAGMTADELHLKFVQDATAQLSLTRQLAASVTDTDVQKYFDAHPGTFDQPARARVRELLLLTTVGYSSKLLPFPTIEAKHTQIFDLAKRVRAGEDFTALAKQYNEDPVSKDTSGELSFPRDQMEFGDLAFSMQTNQISDVITNSDGFRFFQLLEIIPAKKIELAAIAGRIKNGLIGEQKRRRGPAYLEKLRTEAGVEILDAGLKAQMAAAEAQAAQAAQAQAAFAARQAAAATNQPPPPQ